MTNYLPLLLGVIGLVLVFASIVNVKLGQYISTLTTPKSGGLWYSKPETSSMIASCIVIAMFVTGSYLLWNYISNDIILAIVGTVLIIFGSMISFTNLILAGAVINAINHNNEKSS